MSPSFRTNIHRIWLSGDSHFEEAGGNTPVVSHLWGHLSVPEIICRCWACAYKKGGVGIWGPEENLSLNLMLFSLFPISRLLGEQIHIVLS